MSGYRLVTSDLLQSFSSGQNYFRSDVETAKIATNVNYVFVANTIFTVINILHMVAVSD
jgi:hypothetical protein